MSKENIFKKIARMNSKNKSKKKDTNKTPEQIKKAKTIRYSLFGLGFVSLSAIAIGVPIGFANVKKVVIDKRDDNSLLVSFSSPDGKDVDLTMKELLDSVKVPSVLNKEKMEEAKKTLVKYLYQEEYEASKLFKEAWDKSYVEGKTSSNSIFNPNFKSYEEVQNEQKNKLEDQRRQYQKNYGYENWESEFNKFLTTNAQFGGATTFEKAVEHLTYTTIQAKALSRFTPEFSTAFLAKDVKNRVLSEDVKDKNGNIVFAKGERLFKDIIILDDSSDKGNSATNAFLPNIDKKENAQKTPKELAKIAEDYRVSAFLTKSYVKEYMNANNVVNKFYFSENAILKDQFYFYDISQLTINATQNQTNAQSFWKIAKNDLKELLKYSVTELNENNTTKTVKTHLELIENFKGASSDDKNQNVNDKILLDSINSSVNKSNAQFLGQKGLRNLSQIFSGEDASYALAFVNDVYSAKEANNIFSQTLFTKIKEKIFKNGNEILLPESSSLANKSLSEITELNRKLSEFIDKLSDGDLNLVGDAFKETFGETSTNGQPNSYKISTIYKLSENNFVVYSSKGLNIVTKNEINTFDKLQNILKKELQLNANNQNDSSFKSRLQVSQLFDQLKEDQFVLKELLTNDKFKNKLLEENQANATQEAKDEYLNTLNKNIDNAVNSYSLNKILEINKKVEPYLETVRKNNLNADYKFSDSLNQWVIVNKETKSDIETIFEALQKHYGIKK
ncbi:HinT-interacting membrane complex protein P80 [Mesomycoplasma lagogenitalium]|uniref:Membrane protein P80 n=1 Tax=Mesomycoplasma lagogenitalium TaxID=171286 RepID=A0ABY8LU65_9BACT|nr:hypothetical protein [Mesomycoplasma lagogenitalium]WGI36789.1 hypothetical protein QEG99_00665 [Mesomycoplasma lagogenitalium]